MEMIAVVFLLMGIVYTIFPDANTHFFKKYAAKKTKDEIEAETKMMRGIGIFQIGFSIVLFWASWYLNS